MENAVFWDVAPCGYLVRTDVSEERVAPILRLEKSVSEGKR
jgi:hypothetical protein